MPIFGRSGHIGFGNFDAYSKVENSSKYNETLNLNKYVHLIKYFILNIEYFILYIYIYIYIYIFMYGNKQQIY